jgi:hypothetical protein
LVVPSLGIYITTPVYQSTRNDSPARIFSCIVQTGALHVQPTPTANFDPCFPFWQSSGPESILEANLHSLTSPCVQRGIWFLLPAVLTVQRSLSRQDLKPDRPCGRIAPTLTLVIIIARMYSPYLGPPCFSCLLTIVSDYVTAFADCMRFVLFDFG